MRISDWSSDVCSSDLIGRAELGDFALHPDVEIIDREVDRRVGQAGKLRRQDGAGHPSARGFRPQLAKTALRKGGGESGRASCRERGWQSGLISVAAV